MSEEELKKLDITESELTYLKGALDLQNKSPEEALGLIRMAAEEFDRPEKRRMFAGFIQINPEAASLIAVI